MSTTLNQSIDTSALFQLAPNAVPVNDQSAHAALALDAATRMAERAAAPKETILPRVAVMPIPN